MTRIVVDSSYLAYRALYGMGRLDANDVATGVLFNFLTTVLDIGTRFATNQFIFAFDSFRDDCVRRKVYAPYKSKRDEVVDPEDVKARAEMRWQVNLLKTQILWYMGFKDIFYFKGFESDDIIAAVVGKDGKKKGQCDFLPAACTDSDRFVIVSRDHDLFQLLSGDGRVIMYDASARTIYTKEDLLKEHGTTPDKWAYVLALAGCETDNVEGIAGIGVKTAVKSIHTPDVLTERQKALIHGGESIISRNYPLVSLPHKEFPWDLIDIRGTQFDGKAELCGWTGFEKICKDYKFASFLREPMLSDWKRFYAGAFAGVLPPCASGPMVAIRPPSRTKLPPLLPDRTPLTGKPRVTVTSGFGL